MCYKKSNQYKVLYYKLYIGCFNIFKLKYVKGCFQTIKTMELIYSLDIKEQNNEMK